MEEEGAREDFSEVVIRDALDKAGYIHEQRVAQRLERLGFHVETNWIYPDSLEKKSRELDVRAYRQFLNSPGSKSGVAVELLIECKSGKSPYVLFMRDKGTYDKNIRIPQHIFPRKNYSSKLTLPDGKIINSQQPPYPHFNLYESNPMTAPSKAATQFCKIVRDGRKVVASHADAHSRLVLPLLNATLHQIQERRGHVESVKGHPFLVLIYPIALVGGKVYESELADGGEEFELNEVGFGVIQQKLQSDGESERILLSFVSDDRLEKFIETYVVPFANHLVSMLETRPEDFV